MAKKSFKEPEKSRHIKYMLYPDCSAHVELMEKIKTDKFPFIGIQHHIVDLDDNPITEGQGKPHFHIYQEFKNAVHPSALAKRYGVFDDSGKPDTQFIRTIGGQYLKALQYLTHLNTPEKEQYSKSDLFGWDSQKRLYDQAELAFFDKHITLRDGLFAMMFWAENEMRGQIINSAAVIKWLCGTPYLRFRNERLFHQLIAEHNQRLWRLQEREFQSLSDRGISLDSAALTTDFREMTDDEYNQLGLGVQFDE